MSGPTDALERAEREGRQTRERICRRLARTRKVSAIAAIAIPFGFMVLAYFQGCLWGGLMLPAYYLFIWLERYLAAREGFYQDRDAEAILFEDP